MASSISPLSYTQVAQQASPTSTSSSSGTNGQIMGVSANEDTFLTLLVAQLKNQDPLSPTDSTQFVSELAQFSSLEQLVTMNQNVATITKTVAPGSTTTDASSTSGATSSSGTDSNSDAAQTGALNNALDNSGLLGSVS